jgi:hypothetical protein
MAVIAVIVEAIKIILGVQKIVSKWVKLRVSFLNTRYFVLFVWLDHFACKRSRGRRL